MRTNEIYEALAVLSRKSRELEDLYCDNGGEVTEETAALDEEIDKVKQLLEEGVDDLGRWLKSKQDELAAAKAEKDQAARRVKAVEKSVLHVTELIGTVMDRLEKPVVKGTYYGFKRTTSTTRTVLSEAINEDWLAPVVEAAREQGLPDGIDVVLKATVGSLTAGQLGCYLHVDENPAVSFTKPRKPKEEADHE